MTGHVVVLVTMLLELGVANIHKVQTDDWLCAQGAQIEVI